MVSILEFKKQARKQGKQKTSPEAAEKILHRRINNGYLISSIRTWMLRIIAALVLVYGLYLFYTDFTVWLEAEIRERYGSKSEQQ
jgi:hypothetical protein